MEIIDTQIHFGPGGIDRVIGAMDGIGISKALIDEYWGRGIHLPPGYPLAGGGFRATAPTAELACAQHPDRFSYLLRIHRLDPEVNSLSKNGKRHASLALPANAGGIARRKRDGCVCGRRVRRCFCCR